MIATTKKTRRVSAFLALLLLVSFLVSCGAASPMGEFGGQAAAAPTTAPAASARNPSQGSGASDSSALSADEAKKLGSSESTSPSGSTSNASATAPWDRMVIRTTNLAITVINVESAVNSIRDIAQATESFVSSSQTQNSGDKMTATIILQVPARGFDGVVQQVRKLATVVDSENTSSQDVTEEFVDVQAQIKNLQATEQTMVRLFDKAVKMDEILAIQRELTSIRGQIERFQGRSNYLQRRTDYSTVQIRISPVSTVVDPFASSSWQPLRTAGRAWQASLQTISAVVDVVIAVVVFLWWLIPIVALGVWLWRRGRRNRPRTPVAAAAGGGSATPPGPTGPTAA